MVRLFAIALLLHKNKTLLVRRVNASFGNGMYSLIGGKVDPGEPALRAMHRETLEETGLNIPEDHFKLVHTYHRKGPTEELLALVFQADISHLGAPTNKEPEKHDVMEFFPIDQLPENILAAHKQAIELIQKNIPYSEHNW